MPTTGAFSNYTEDKIVDIFLRGDSYNGGTVYLALFTAVSSGETPSVTEVNPAGTWTDYARQSAAWTAIDSGTGETKNDGTITFPANDGASDITVTHIGVYDALTSGNLLFYAELTTPKTLAQGDVLSFASNSIVFTIN
jgi:hypothetical protein